MNNLRTKFIIIVATVLLCVYGIIGIPWPLNQFGAKVKENFNERIRLGLDLKGEPTRRASANAGRHA